MGVKQFPWMPESPGSLAISPTVYSIISTLTWINQNQNVISRFQINTGVLSFCARLCLQALKTKDLS